jgi:cysteine desulfurase/selenocysteine lyase
MNDQLLTTEFGPFGDRVWLNCAHQGPLPRAAAEAAQQAVTEKQTPHLIQDEAFWEVPAQLKELIGWLINAPTSEVILGNSTTYGLNLLVQGLPWQEGDEILLIDGDFPATVVTWFPLRDRGIKIRLLTPRTNVITAEELEQAIGPSTRVFCSSWVFSFFGHAIDVDAIGEVCKAHDVLFVLNGSQAIGTRSIDFANSSVDVIVGCGFKWLCGPYGTGFCSMRSDLLDSLQYKQAYWLTQISKEDLSQEAGYELRAYRDASSYDVFCTANFLNFMPWTQSIQTLLDVGMNEIASHNEALVDQLIAGLNQDRFDLISPAQGPERSTLVLVAHRDRSKSPEIYRALEKNGIHVALRDDKISFSPHLYNSTSDIDRALEVLSVNA